MEECHVFEDHKGKIHLFTELQSLLKQKESLIKAINHLESDIEDDSKFATFVIETCKNPEFKFRSTRCSFYEFEELCLSFIHYNRKRQTKAGEKRSCFKEIREIKIQAKKDQLASLESRIGQLKPITPRNPTVDDIPKLKKEQHYLLKANSIKEKCFKTFKDAALAKVQMMSEGPKRSKDLKKIMLAFGEFELCSAKLEHRLANIARKIEELENAPAKKPTTSADDNLEESIDQLIEIDLRNLEYNKHSTDNEDDEKAYSVQEKVYSVHEKVDSEDEKAYSEDEKAYSEDEKVYSVHEKVDSEDDMADYEATISDDYEEMNSNARDLLEHEKKSTDSLDCELLPKANELSGQEELEYSKLEDLRLFRPTIDDLSSEDFNPDGLDPTTDGEEFMLFDAGDIQEAADYLAERGPSD